MVYLRLVGLVFLAQCPLVLGHDWNLNMGSENLPDSIPSGPRSDDLEPYG